MKSYKIVFALLLSLSCLTGLLGQTNKKTLNYQAVILDPKAIDIPGASIVGQPLNKGNVCLRFSLLNAQGGLDYEETQQVTTDEYGLVNVAIGAGAQAQAGNNTSIYKSFESVIWNSSVKSLKVSVSYDGCNSFKQVSAQALNYTPYALYAEAVDYKNVREAPTKLSQFSNDPGYLISKDLDPLKSDIQTNSSKIEVANKSIADNKQASDASFLIVNQSITSLDTQVAANTTAIKENTSSISNINTKITDQQNQIVDNRNQITATNNNLNTQIGGLQGQLNTTNSTVNSLTGAAEVVSNKSTAINLGGANPSDQLYPSQKAAKSYIDNAIYDAVGSGVPDATTLAAGKVKLAGDLGGTAISPTVPALAGKENSSNKSTATDLGAGNPSDQLYPSQKATKAYVDNSIYAAVGTGVPDATTNAAGKVKLAGDLSGTAEIPLVAKIQGSPVSSTTPTTGQVLTYNGTSWAPAAAGSSNKEDVSNKSDGALGTSTTLYPTQNAVKTYVDARVASATIADADASTKGKIQLAGDLSGTAESPVVASNAITTSKILDANVTDAKIATVSGSKVTGNITGSAANVTGTVGVANGGTGATTLTGIIKGTGTSALTAAIAGTDYQAPITLTTTGTGAATLSGTTLNIPAVSSTVNSNTLSGTVAVVNGGTGATSKTTAFDALSPMTTAGDLIYGGTNGTGTRLAKGNNGTVLTMENNVPTWLTSIRATSGSTYNAAVGFSFIGGDWARNTGMFSDNPDAGVSATLKFRIATSNGTAHPYLEISQSKVSVLPITSSTSKTTGALTVAGGLGVDGNIYASNLNVSGAITGGTWSATTIAIANGGTGATTATDAFNALAPSQTSNSGKYLTTDGTNASWTSASAMNANLNDQTGTTYTLLSSDNGKVITLNNASAITLTVASGLGAGFNCMIVQKGAGLVTLVGAGGVTVTNRIGFTKTGGTNAIVTLIAITSNYFVSGGDMQ